MFLVEITMVIIIKYKYSLHRIETPPVLNHITGDMVRIRHLSIYDMMPTDSNYITYEGSMTQPGCLETVTWIIFNRPLYVTRSQVLCAQLSSLFPSQTDQ